MHIIERNYNDFWGLKYVDLDNGDQNVNLGIISKYRRNVSEIW